MLVQFTMYGDPHMRPVTGAPMDAGQLDKVTEGGLWTIGYEDGPWAIVEATPGPNGGAFTDRVGMPLICVAYRFPGVSLVKDPIRSDDRAWWRKRRQDKRAAA